MQMRQEFAFNAGYIKSEFESVNVVSGECQGLIRRFQSVMEKAGKNHVELYVMLNLGKVPWKGRRWHEK